MKKSNGYKKCGDSCKKCGDNVVTKSDNADKRKIRSN